MPLDGLRAWVAEVERKLGKRTRVFLALCVISIGIAGAAVYLAIDARNSSVSESDVQELQRELEARIDEGATEASAAPGPAPETTTPKSKGKAESKAPESSAELEDLLDQARKQAE
jgi:hypothetical protein